MSCFEIDPGYGPKGHTSVEIVLWDWEYAANARVVEKEDIELIRITLNINFTRPTRESASSRGRSDYHVKEGPTSEGQVNTSILLQYIHSEIYVRAMWYSTKCWWKGFSIKVNKMLGETYGHLVANTLRRDSSCFLGRHSSWWNARIHWWRQPLAANAHHRTIKTLLTNSLSKPSSWYPWISFLGTALFVWNSLAPILISTCPLPVSTGIQCLHESLEYHSWPTLAQIARSISSAFCKPRVWLSSVSVVRSSCHRRATSGPWAREPIAMTALACWIKS